MNNLFILAIDGPAGSGKSSIAKQICILKGWSHLNTGLFYRGIAALAAINKRDIKDEKQLLSVADDFLEHANWQNMFEEKLRIKRIELFRVLHQPSVAIGASFVAKSKVIRDKLLEPQRIVANSCKSGGVVIDGRDVGTVVFPNASLKI